jgi:2-polyprenyl-6-methoxyphenol hydroxylase-like FAD-dependent oxidoreductase
MNPSSHPSPSGRRFDVVVRGGGIVGQSLALLLAQDRLRVALVGEPAPSDRSPDVRAYALNAASRRLLESLRAWPSDAHSTTPISAMRVHADAGGRLGFDARDQGADALGWIVDVPLLEEQLAQAVSYQSGIERLEQAPSAPLTVVCEGKRSATRASRGLDFLVKPYAHKALAARLLCERPHGGVAHQWFANSEIMALLPMGGHDGRTMALVWSAPIERTDARIASGDWLAEVQSRSQSVLGELSVSGAAQAWPLELSTAKRWLAQTPEGTVALAGDAAHAMHPLAGQGLNLGLADVAELARVLREREYWRPLGDWRLLRRYERARAADVSAMAWVTDGLFGLFDHTDGRIQTLRNWGLNQFDRSGPIKQWMAQHAMGATPQP